MNRNGISSNVLTRGAIKEINTLEVEKGKMMNVDYTLQVLSVRKKEDQGKTTAQIFTCTLSDGEYKYTGFVIFGDNSGNELRVGDIIRVLNLSINILNQQKNRVCVVKKYEVCERGVQQVGMPELLKDDGSSKDKVQANITAGQSNTNYANSDVRINNTIKDNNPSIKESTGYNPNNTSSGRDFSKDNRDSHRRNFYHPLSSLTTFSKDIQIFVRVLKKTERKSFNSRGGQGGSLFSFNVMDQDGYEMQATCFTKACDKFYDMIKENHIYEIQGGYVKVNDKKFSSVKSEYKLILDENVRITEKEDDGSIKEISFEFIKIVDIGSLQVHSVVDIFAYVLEVTDKNMKNTKFKGEQQMRKIVVCDDSEFKIEFTLWRDHADMEIRQGQVLSVKSAKVGDFNGRNISTVDDTKILIEPSIKESFDLKHFVKNYRGDWKTFNGVVGGSGVSSDVNSSANLVYIKEALAVLDSGEPDDRIPVSKVKATICTINHSEKNFYPGCADKTCKKKLVQETYNWTCNNCNKTYPAPTYYYTLSFRIKDASAEFWVDVFGDLGAKMFKMPCEDYKDLVINRDEIRLKEITSQLEFQSFFFVVKPKLNIYNNVPKKKLNVFRVEPIEHATEIRKVAKNLFSLLNIRK